METVGYLPPREDAVLDALAGMHTKRPDEPEDKIQSALLS